MFICFCKLGIEDRERFWERIGCIGLVKKEFRDLYFENIELVWELGVMEGGSVWSVVSVEYRWCGVRCGGYIVWNERIIVWNISF